MNDVKIETEVIRLDAFLKWAAIVQSGAEAKMFIQDSEVKVNNEVCTQRSKKLKKGDIINFKGDEYKII